ncbi:MAG TPA: 2-oxoglutarate and iron-dependent oxygenase domain-containing protein [Rhodopila sp.]|uniref:isopenicillin N synthase family dioxygenase n=1 Tax=Rhodopila sp. TaxID=2480087 RepID=UPI002BC95046|nr:2-oxoglutarate and iron-dependent oxygenase domain-containing protein [Rhodopila sp.]HVY14463.1 2-oxoglutarate and iron-dependent oxygenase domain-containing protein [Rhodopila sp.]
MLEETIPILDLAPYLAGKPGADHALAEQLRWASENIGFYFITNHGVPQSLIDQTFVETARFHAQPMEEKMKLLINKDQIGYLPMGGAKMRSSEVNKNTRHDLNEALFIRRERVPDDPDVIARKPWRGLNQWPTNLPGFRENVLAYWTRMEQLAQSLLPLYDLALGLPNGFFRQRFEGAHINLRLSHYPPVEAEENQFGIAPHTDSGFMTFLPQSAVPGLEILTVTKKWIAAPPMPGTFLVNTGDILCQWTNKRFRSTPHRAVNRSPAARYAIPFFYDPNTDTVIECLPGCSGVDNPPRYPTRTFGEYYAWFVKMNYRHQEEAAA